MKNTYRKSPDFNPAGLAAGSILVLLTAMTISLVFGIEPFDDAAAAPMAHTGAVARF